MKRLLRWFGLILLTILLLLTGPLLALAFGDIDLDTHWSDANHDSAGIAPDPVDSPEAVVQIYSARAYRWRGAFGSHSWIAIKPTDADYYTVYQVVGWRLRWDSSAISVHRGGPADFHWYNARPQLLVDVRGDTAAQLIPRIRKAVADYPHANEYRAWPGPNSNTFIAWVARQVPELRLDLPATAIGKDYLPNGELTGPMPSGTGYQISAHGLLGAGLALEEGLEFNLLGLSFGIDFNDLALRVPGWGWLPERRAAAVR